MRELRDPQDESEDVARGASMSLRVTINRVLWREAEGRWPDDRISSTRRELEQAIDRLIHSEVERHQRGEIFPHERAGRSVLHEQRRGKSTMTPLSPEGNPKSRS